MPARVLGATSHRRRRLAPSPTPKPPDRAAPRRLDTGAPSRRHPTPAPSTPPPVACYLVSPSPLPPSYAPLLTFLIAEACLLAGLVQSAYHTGYRTVIFENPPDCETVRRGTFGAGAAFALITGVLTGFYYYNFSKARVAYQRPEAAIGMSRYS
ncbi:uncharacterized protein [Triticum aestivum]|uniref:uncharacterized protein isoform X2 n=1 Tax=Triticum aestivum TaxID=4565 RepID=UPI001D025A2A|nr:uncharacterized protein LOC123122670 isoform X2 [Triticum aestivum]